MKAVIAVVAAGMLLAACMDRKDKEIYVETYPEVSLPVEIAFKAVAGNTAINCDAQLSNLGVSNASATIADFRFYVHNVRLLLDSGDSLPVQLDETTMQTDNIALLDFRDRLLDGNVPCAGDANPNLNTKLRGKVVLEGAVRGNVTGIAFTLGVPFSHNHASQTNAKGPLRNPGMASGMAWSWQTGYKFTGLDVTTSADIQRYDAEGNPTGTATRWNTHLGSAGCSVSTSDLSAGTLPQPCPYPNHSDIVLADFSFNKTIQLDYAELVSSNNLLEDHGGAVGCMSGVTDPECEALFEKLGLVHALSGADPQHPPLQTVFSLVD